MYLVLLILIAAILHASLYPWEFLFTAPEVNPLISLLTSWRPLTGRRDLVDVAVNVVFYVPLGAAAYLAFSRRLRPDVSVVLAVGLGFALSAAVEMVQLFTPSRVCNTRDLFCNVFGAGLGVAAGMIAHGRLNRAVHPHVPAGALVLLCSWAAYQLFPFYPETTKHAMLLKLDGLLDPAPFSVLAAALAAAEWLALARLIEICFEAKRGRWLIAVLPFLLPAKMLMAGRAVTSPEIVGAAAGLAMGAFLRVPFAAAAGLLAAAVVARGLTPLEIADARPFQWVPFVSLIDWREAAPIVLRKAFWYGSILLLLRTGGAPYARSGALLVALLAGVEAAQTRLAGHVAESTDPLLAAVAAFALWQSHRATVSPKRI